MEIEMCTYCRINNIYRPSNSILKIKREKYYITTFSSLITPLLHLTTVSAHDIRKVIKYSLRTLVCMYIYTRRFS